MGVPLLGISLAVWGLWLYSGREVWTKSRKAVEVEVADELFGGTVTRTRMIEGPIGGYYVGLDVTLAITAGVLAAGGICWWRMRHRETP